MAYTKDDIYETLDGLIPSSLSCDWDNDGYMIKADGECHGVLLTLDVTAAAVDFAIERGLDCIVSHHPMIFRPLKAVTDEKIIKCVRNGIAVMSFHTRLDARQPGVNDMLASQTGAIGDIEAHGMLRVGEACESDIGRFAAAIKEALGAPDVKYAGNRPVRRAAMIGGSGKDFIPDAIALGCDTLVTGEVGYNAACDAADMGLNIIEAGHYYTERPVLRLLCDLIAENHPGINIEYFDSCPHKHI